MNIQILDSFLSLENHHMIWEYSKNAEFNIIESDYPNNPPTGKSHNLSLDNNISKILLNSLNDKSPNLKDKNLYRAYINYFPQGINPYWHQDGEGYTCLYYPNLEYNELNEGGETQFLINGPEIKGILPIPNRMVVFDGMIYHKANSFRTQSRYTIALKFGF